VRREIACSLIALALLAAAGVAVALPIGRGEVPLRSSMESIPYVFAGWRPITDFPAEILVPDKRAPNRLERGYEGAEGPIWAVVEYFPSQDESRRAAAREFVFPGAGWSQINEREVTIAVPGRDQSIEANLVVVEAGGRRFAISYWYQIGQAAVASDHGYRAQLLYNRLVRGRSDGALVRIASPLPSGEDGAVALTRHAEFLRAFYPALLKSLPL
jgi:EpsI family protein